MNVKSNGKKKEKKKLKMKQIIACERETASTYQAYFCPLLK